MMRQQSIKPVTVLSDKRISPARIFRVPVHFVESGIPKLRTIGMQAATRFDSLVVVRVSEVSPACRPVHVRIDSLNNLMRFAYHNGKFAYRAIQRPINFPSAVVDTRCYEPNNIAHLLLHVIPYCLYIKRFVTQDPTVLFRKLHAPYAELCELFLPTIIREERAISADFIYVRGTRGLAVYDLLNTFDIVSLDYLPGIYRECDLSLRGYPNKVFLARRGSRSITNQGEVEKLLKNYGYTTIYMEDYPIREQLGIAAGIRHVVAIHGAALALLAINSHVDSVIELLPSHTYHEIFPVALGSRVKHYEQIIPEFDKNVVHRGWPAILQAKNSPFHVQIDMLERCLDNIRPSSGETRPGGIR